MKVTDPNATIDRRARSGVDQNGFARLFERSRPRLLLLSRRILGKTNDAEDAVHETYLRAFANLSSFDGKNLEGWLSRIHQRVCIDQIRSGHPLEALDQYHEPEATYNELSAVTALQIRTIIARLPEAQRLCLKLFYFDGRTAKEVAKVTGFSEKQVKSHLQNGRRNFKSQWEGLKKKTHE